MKTLLAILLLTATIVRGQNSITADFLLDSLGCNGLRQKHVKQVPFDDLNKRPISTNSYVQALFDGKSVISESREYIISLLGSPNWTHHSKDKNKMNSKTDVTCRIINDTLTIIAYNGKKKKGKNIEEMHYRINTCGNKRLGTTLIIFLTDNKVTDAFLETMN